MVRVTPNHKHVSPMRRPTSGGRIGRQDQGIRSQSRNSAERVEVCEEPGNKINDKEAGGSVVTAHERLMSVLLSKGARKIRSAAATLQKLSTENRQADSSPMVAAKVPPGPHHRDYKCCQQEAPHHTVEWEEAKASQGRGYPLQKQIGRNVKDGNERSLQIRVQIGGTGGHDSSSASTHVPARTQPKDVMMQADPCNTVNCADTGHNRRELCPRPQGEGKVREGTSRRSPNRAPPSWQEPGHKSDKKQRSHHTGAPLVVTLYPDKLGVNT